MTYLCITPFFPTDSSFRGSFIYDQVCAIERTGKFSDVVIIKPCKLMERAEKYSFGGVTVFFVPSLQLPSMIFNGLFSSFNNWLLIRKLKSLEIDFNAIKIVHVHTSLLASYALALKKINNEIYTVVQYHNPDPFCIRLGCVQRWKWHQRFFVERRVACVSKMDLHVGVSHMVLDQVKAFPESNVKVYDHYLKCLSLLSGLAPVDIKNSYVLYNGVDEKKFFIDERKILNDSVFRIGCVANFIDWKSQVTLLHAVKILTGMDVIRGLKVILIGTGPTLGECKEFVQQSSLSDFVSFQSEIPHAELKEFFASLDLFVLPSYFEGFGCVFLEAYACGTPFICVKGQGISEYIKSEDEQKWLMDAFDYEQLAALIANFYSQRYAQELAYPFLIDELVSRFLDEVESHSNFWL